MHKHSAGLFILFGSFIKSNTHSCERPAPHTPLAGLKELELTIGHRIHERRFHVPSDLGVFTHMAPALRQLTGLTSLHAPGFSPRPQQLPSSLLELCAARPSRADRINWQSLRGVTRLLLSSGGFHSWVPSGE